jgi:hypothetical protein
MTATCPCEINARVRRENNKKNRGITASWPGNTLSLQQLGVLRF